LYSTGYGWTDVDGDGIVDVSEQNAAIHLCCREGYKAKWDQFQGKYVCSEHQPCYNSLCPYLIATQPLSFITYGLCLMPSAVACCPVTEFGIDTYDYTSIVVY
jgi:hypothetical protein